MVDFNSLHLTGKEMHYKNKHAGRVLSERDWFADTLMRLPMFYDLEIVEMERTSSIIKNLF